MIGSFLKLHDLHHELLHTLVDICIKFNNFTFFLLYLIKSHKKKYLNCVYIFQYLKHPIMSITDSWLLILHNTINS